MKTGIGKNNSDVDVTIDQVGLKTALGVEILDASGNQITFPTAGKVSSVGSGTKSVVTTGTAVQLSLISVACSRVIVQAHESNQGTIVVGDGNVVAALIGRRGLALYPTNSTEFKVSNLNMLYIDSTASGDQVTYYYEVI